MSNPIVAEVRIEGDAKDVISEFRPPQSRGPLMTPVELPRASAQNVTGHADGYGNTEKIPSGNAQRIDAEQGSNIANVLSPMSPPSSDSRASLRAEVLNGSPMERRGFNKPPLSFGSVVANPPAPVFTGVTDRFNEQLRLLHRPSLMQMPTPNLEGSVNNNDRPRTEESRPFRNSCWAAAPISSLNSRSTVLDQYGYSDIDHTGSFQTADDIMDMNPYIRRADEIGGHHQVPDVGHLGCYLGPPGWIEGDSPITPTEAKRLFDIDRQEAVHEFDRSLANLEHQNVEEKERFRTKANDEWYKQHILNWTVFEQRVLIYHQHQERQQRKMERSRGNSYGLFESRLSEVSQPSQPRAMASHTAASLPESPYWQGIPTHENQTDGPYGNPRTSQNVGSWQSRTGPEKSPFVLDHNQRPIQMGNAYTHYQTNTAEIAQQMPNNQQYFNEHDSVPKHFGTQEQNLQRVHPSSMSVRPAVFFEGNNTCRSSHGCPPEQGPISFNHNGYSHIEPICSERALVRSATFEGDSLYRANQHHPAQSKHGVFANTNIYHGSHNLPIRERQPGHKPQYMIPPTGLAPTRDRSIGRENPLGNFQNEVNKTGGPSIGGSRVSELGGQFKQEPSNRTQHGQKESAAALRLEPRRDQQSNRKATGAKRTSNISTTMNGPPTVNERTVETKTDKTGQWYENEAELAKLPTLIPSKEFVRAVLEEAEAENRGGVKSTLRKRRPRPDVDATRGFSITDAAAKLLAIKGIPDHRQYSPAVSPGAMLGRNTVSPNVAPGSENGSDVIEDPNDGDYGKRTTRRRTTTPRKQTASRSNAALSKKRKAVASTTPVKRTRLGMDGPADESEDDAGVKDDLAWGNLTRKD